MSDRTLYTIEAILLILIGIGAIALPGVFTLSIELVFGFLLLIAGAYQFFRAFTQRANESQSWWWGVLSGLLNVVIGVLFLANPLLGIFTLTLLLMTYFIVSGCLQIGWAWQMRHSQAKSWAIALNGVLGLLLGFIIFMGLPTSAIWVVGLLFGVNMLISGVALLALAWSGSNIDHDSGHENSQKS